jgi:bifunctional DNA-binding transcriptional regulator/antitoxin component of YhaV-PrlF toxin-antitoxin module
MLTSKLMAGNRTTVPAEVRAALELREGDTLVYKIKPDCVLLTTAHASVSCEWATEADNLAFGKL